MWKQWIGERCAVVLVEIHDISLVGTGIGRDVLTGIDVIGTDISLIVVIP